MISLKTTITKKKKNKKSFQKNSFPGTPDSILSTYVSLRKVKIN